ncbi:hypothetical protein [Nonomuraea aridisoli]|uniref:Uncharacterized protein n=1 Tax=Nonomuraea aridisoli TaxID=2070368 RepID=A0A2W2EKH7_9ACTN|nr:hypothetical protein [Nonomuraea aridisoli]PZG22833.1 hypothetical protein C1J01_03070 [Nonomuraea aridisoli]
MAVLHPRRVAWEGARLFALAADTDAYWWLSEAVGHYLGLMYRLQLYETRLRLKEDADLLYEETGAWRARLDELLDTRPETASILTQLIAETAARLP